MPRILIIDDDPNLCSLLEQIFSGPGYQVLVANDGIRGLQVAKEYKPDVVIVDLNMPEVNGHQVCVGLRADPDTAKVPIMMLTAVRELPAAMKGMASGANDFMTKPFQNDEVVARVEALLKRRS